eukprot:9563600-Alexandrium_andersonii.AAC.1
MALRLWPSGATRGILSPGSPFGPLILMSFHCPTSGRISSRLALGAASPGHCTEARMRAKPFSMCVA